MSFKFKCPLLYCKQLPIPGYPINMPYVQYFTGSNQEITPYTRGNSLKLDSIKHIKGIDALKATFCKMVKEDLENAVEDINSESLSFGSLFALKSEAKLPVIFEHLKTRNKITLAVMDEVLENKRSLPLNEYSLCSYIEAFHSTLKWILETGFEDDGLRRKKAYDYNSR